MTDLHTEIVNTARALILAFDPEGRIRLFNRACEQLSGYRFEEMKGTRGWKKLLPEDELDGAVIAFGEMRQGRFPSTYKNHWVTRTGERRSIEWSNSAVTDDRGRVTYIIATGIDVTEREAAEKALRETEQRQRALLDSLPDAAWLKNEKGVFLEVNCCAAGRCGRDRGDLIGRTADEFMPAEVAERWAEQEHEAMKSRKPWHGEEFRSVNGETRCFNSVVSPVIGENGDVIGTAGVSRDVTETKLAEARRMASHTMQRESLVREVNHRIKNNLQGAVSLVQQVAADHPESAALLDSVITRLDAIACMHGLYGSIGDRELRVEEVILRLVSSLKVIFPDIPVNLAMRSGSTDTLVAASEIVPLAVILNELIWNAVKHSRGISWDAPVEVVLEGAGDRADIVIRNQAGRLRPDLNFDAGTGLGTGLLLVKSLLPLHGASLRFHDSRESGVRVELTLRPPVVGAATVAP